MMCYYLYVQFQGQRVKYHNPDWTNIGYHRVVRVVIQMLPRMILDWNYSYVGRMIMNWEKLSWFGMSVSGKDKYGLWMMSMNWEEWSWVEAGDYKFERLMIHSEGWVWIGEGYYESGKNSLKLEGFVCSWLIRCILHTICPD